MTPTMTVNQLRSVIDELAVTLPKTFEDSLEQRKREEIAFHDTYRAGTERGAAVLGHDTSQPAPEKTEKARYSNKSYYTVTGASSEYVRDWIARNAPGKVFLDFACGEGKYAIAAAQAGAALGVGIDISPVAVSIAASQAAKAGVSANSKFLQSDAENTRLPDRCIDLAICSGVLHHMDLSYAIPELRRIMKPSGRVLVVEALSVNPLFSWYRRRTPEMRTKWESEHILGPKDVTFMSRFFEISDLRYWHMAVLFAPLFGVRRRVPLLDTVDAALLRIPGLRLMAWMMSLELVRK